MSESSLGKSNTGRKTTATTSISQLQTGFRFLSIILDKQHFFKQNQLTAGFDIKDSRSEGSDLTVSKAADAEDDADPSNEAEDRSC